MARHWHCGQYADVSQVVDATPPKKVAADTLRRDEHMTELSFESNMKVSDAKLAFGGGVAKSTTLKQPSTPAKSAPVAQTPEEPKTAGTLISKFGGKSSPVPSSSANRGASPARASPATSALAPAAATTPGFGKISSLELRSSQTIVVDETVQERIPPSKEAETEIRRWLEAAGGLEINDLETSLKSGEVLCNLMNKIQPGAIKNYHKGSRMAFKQMENIGWFLEAALKYGVKASDLFVTVNLFEGNNMKQVVITITALRKLAESKGFRV